MYEVIIIGGGASGLFLASLLRDKRVLIVTKNFGAKIEVSGGGKCNITNKSLSPHHYKGNPNFIKKVFEKFNNRDLLNWLDRNDLKVRELKPNQYFFNSSKTILNFFKNSIKHKIIYADVLDIEGNEIITNRGKFRGKNIVVATGGVSFKKLGATDFAFRIAEKFNLKVNPLKPALVGFTVQPSEYWFKNLSGISLNVEVEVGKRKIKGDALFSHRGITGPAILNASLFWEKGKIKINFLPQRVSHNPKKIVSTQLPLPKRFVKEYLKALNLKDIQMKKLPSFVYEFAPAGTFGFEKAEVTKGGIDTGEVNEFMRSESGIYFLGECLDVTGMVGGYNFQWAFSSAFCAYLDLKERL